MSTQFHNPDKLTEWGQLYGWRLLTVEEIRKPLPKDAEYLDGENAAWCASSYRGEVAQIVDQKHTTYRTCEPLPSQPDDLSYYEHDLPKIIAGVRRGEKWEIMWMEVPPEERKWTIPMEDTLEFLYDQIKSGQYRVRLAPVPVVKPWSEPADVPVNCWLRTIPGKRRDPDNDLETFVLAVSSLKGVSVVSGDGIMTLPWGHQDWLRTEHSTDRIHWSPCVKPEGGK